LTWIFIGIIGWLGYRQYWLTMALANRNQLISTGAASGAAELLDSDGQVIGGQPPEVNLPPWLWLIAGLIYVICPLDFDFVPLLGWIDDAVVAFLAYQKWRQG
jgi:hypothetical protein